MQVEPVFNSHSLDVDLENMEDIVNPIVANVISDNIIHAFVQFGALETTAFSQYMPSEDSFSQIKYWWYTISITTENIVKVINFCDPTETYGKYFWP